MAMKQVNTDSALFEPLMVSLQLVADYVSQKLLTPFTWQKEGAVQDRIQLVQD
jgi:hypothetical protein